MSEFSVEEVEQRKKAVFDAMSPRRQKHILKKGYDKWDPFEEPKDPIDIRKDQTKRTTQELVREFLQSRSSEEYSNAYGRGVLEMATFEKGRIRLIDLGYGISDCGFKRRGARQKIRNIKPMTR
ncbi:MAG: hypothetical protein JRF60_05585 [Deltaproteobacteria bacterium]|nr:hypothetical protein [Deltaproteobacteria bacterium]